MWTNDLRWLSLVTANISAIFPFGLKFSKIQANPYCCWCWMIFLQLYLFHVCNNNLAIFIHYLSKIIEIPYKTDSFRIRSILSKWNVRYGSLKIIHWLLCHMLLLLQTKAERLNRWLQSFWYIQLKSDRSYLLKSK